MFSGPGISISGSPKQAWKPPEAPGSLKSSFEVFKMPPEAWTCPGLALAWPWPGPGLALALALALAWPGLARPGLAWPDLAWPALA